MAYNYKFKAKVWLYPGMAGWHFITVPKKLSMDIKQRFGDLKRGWGSIPILATIGQTSWGTSIFPDKKSGCYLFPIKAEVRKNENIKYGKILNFIIEIRI